MATAAAIVDGDPAPASAPPAAQPPAPPHCSYKNLLQELLQRAHKDLPKYYTECKGPHHQPKFRCIVKVDGEEFSSDHYHSCIKDAEQDSARVAYDILVRRDANVTDVLELIDQKDAEQKAARAVVKSVLATKNTCMAQIIRSKKKLITAISSPGYNKERGTVGQEINNAPTGIPLPFASIKFAALVAYESRANFSYTTARWTK
ncbi:hypothetical protein GUJ93_ZPchr0008g12705 [Zizania palustris]|uniref:DRBM domain-containing protein n=1 Tax=Zizania palustris TaxID=103762 RepID=A0A8J5UW48_ZIZPA|nr:hypothetical protein GUJ93_ZPchr0008g12705 [Zizania palustris]